MFLSSTELVLLPDPTTSPAAIQLDVVCYFYYFLRMFVSLQQKEEQALYGLSIYSRKRALNHPINVCPDKLQVTFVTV